MKVTWKRLSIYASIVAAVAALSTPEHAARASKAAPADPADPELSARQRLEALVENMQAAAAERETMSAEFTQTKDSSLLIEPSVARGTFSYRAPDSVRWEYRSPHAMTLLIRDGIALTWYRDLGTAERYEVGRQSQRVLEYLSASSSINGLIQYFRVTMKAEVEEGEPYWLHLNPRYSRIAKRLDEVELWIHPETYLPVRLRYAEPGGDVTEYSFSDYEVNAEIPASTFEVELPADVEVRDVELPRRTGGALN